MLLQDALVFDNTFLVSQNEKERLSVSSAMESFEILVRQTEDGTVVTATQFIQEICVSLKAVEAWMAKVVKKFGALAEDSPALERVRSYLLGKKGREEVRALLRENCPLHGHSSTSRGISVCSEQLDP